MTDTFFKRSDGQLVAAINLSAGDLVVDFMGISRQIDWSRVFPKESRKVVDMCTKRSKLTVTASHRVALPTGAQIEANQLRKDDLVAVDSSGSERLQEVKKRYEWTKVVELGFEGDATVPVYVPTILTKGCLPGADTATLIHLCKEEPDMTEPDAQNLGERGSPSKRGQPHDEDSDIPSTDDGFEL